MKSLKMKPPSEEIITEWPTWPFTKLTPQQVAYFEFMQENKGKVLKYNSNLEEAPF